MTLPRGVSKQKDRYEARIRVKGSLMYLGLFDSAEQASQAYVLACQYKKSAKPISKDSIRTELAEMHPEARDQLLKTAGIKRKAADMLESIGVNVIVGPPSVVPPPSLVSSVPQGPHPLDMDASKVVAVPEQPGPPIIPSVKPLGAPAPPPVSQQMQIASHPQIPQSLPQPMPLTQPMTQPLTQPLPQQLHMTQHQTQAPPSELPPQPVSILMQAPRSTHDHGEVVNV